MFAIIKEWLAGQNIPQFNFPGIEMTDIIDILLVWGLLYFFLRWIRQTRTWSLFRGIAVILLIALIAYFLELVAVIWIVRNAYAMGLVAIVILFQPELRKALEQIGRGRLLPTIARPGDRRHGRVSIQTGNEVVKAVKEMAAVKTGALIVLEQDVPLSDHERTGIPLDALVSSQLLLNIFEKNTPLHDGAVMIRNNRITAATCILPLTAEEIGRELGTRHRAAVGMSEASDALVVVVSEETGTISLARGGELARDVNEYRLRELLTMTDAVVEPRFTLFKHRKTNNQPRSKLSSKLSGKLSSKLSGKLSSKLSGNLGGKLGSELSSKFGKEVDGAPSDKSEHKDESK